MAEDRPADWADWLTGQEPFFGSALGALAMQLTSGFPSFISLLGNSQTVAVSRDTASNLQLLEGEILCVLPVKSSSTWSPSALLRSTSPWHQFAEM